MKAILLAAGLGTRLRPITDTMPKCLVEIGNRPLLDYWLECLFNLGVTDVLINLHHHSESVRTYISNSKYSQFVTLIDEPNLLGTAGTLVRNSDFWRSVDTLIIHADNFCLSNLQGLVECYNSRRQGIDVSLLLFESSDPSSCGIVKLSEDNTIVEFHEKVENPPGNLASGALFIFSPQVFDSYFSDLQPDEFYELSIDIIPRMLGRINAWVVDDYYIDIGSIERLAQANSFMLK